MGPHKVSRQLMIALIIKMRRLDGPFIKQLGAPLTGGEKIDANVGWKLYFNFYTSDNVTEYANKIAKVLWSYFKLGFIKYTTN